MHTPLETARARKHARVDGWTEAGPDLGRNQLDRGFGGGITRGLHRTREPIIAALNGWVIGGGIELALACDIRVATEDMQFGFFHMRNGMQFADGGIVRLVNTCGVGIAMELELMGEPITAQRAKEINLVNRVVPRADLMPTVEDIAAKILRNPRRAVESAKDTILEVSGRPLDDQLRLECLYATPSWVIPRSPSVRTRSSAAGTRQHRVDRRRREVAGLCDGDRDPARILNGKTQPSFTSEAEMKPLLRT